MLKLLSIGYFIKQSLNYSNRNSETRRRQLHTGSRKHMKVISTKPFVIHINVELKKGNLFSLTFDVQKCLDLKTTGVKSL